MPMPSNAPREPLSRSVEDYLKAIQRLSDEGRPASTTQIAEALAVAPPSVTGMVKRLSEQGLLEHEPYRGVTLTPLGRREAMRVIRRHRLIESYLVAFLGYRWDDVHDEAERLEHAVSDALVERMAAALGHPAVDPHGDPIPDARGDVRRQPLLSVSALPAGAVAVVRRVATNEAGPLRWFAGEGLVPGARLRVGVQAPEGGARRVELGERVASVPAALARLVECEVVPD
ncbi:MAG: metal-dependent transcriptional regulator [Gemmatimonadales bacterium]|nr:metal-dependent transcriptional regulator [Gemmatimonadales bacterium]